MDMITQTARIVPRYRAVFDAPPRQVPTRYVVDGPILGNGDIGVTLSGPPETQRFWISKCDFWKAHEGYPNAMICVLGWIDVAVDAPPGASYHVEQELYNAEVTGRFTRGGTTLTMRAWVAATEPLLCIELAATGGQVPIDVTLQVQSGNGSETATGPLPDGQWATRRFVNPPEGSDELEYETSAAIALRELHDVRGLLPHENLGWPSQRFLLVPGSPVTIVACVMTNHDTADERDRAIAVTQSVTLDEVERVRQAHRAWWQAFWAQSYVELGDPVIERFWYASQYIMASCSRNTRFPPGLYGNWITTDFPAWGSDYHLNYNYQAPWWGVFSSNHVELAEPYDDPLLAYLPKAQGNAAEIGCRGVYYEVGIGPLGLGTVRGRFYGQKSNASFAAVNMIMRYAYTHDLAYARRVAYPFVREVGDFWEDYLRFEDGRYVIYGDSAHEDNVSGDTNPIVSLGFVRMVFQALLEMSAALECDADRRPKWRHILEHISAYPTMEREGKTVFRYSEDGMAWHDSNGIGIQHIFPGGQIGLDSEPRLLEVARNTVKAMARWEDHNCFSSFYTAAVRVGHDPNEILQHLREQIEKFSLPNLYVYYGGGGIESCGACEAINEMLLQSHEGILRLFPVWPRDCDARFGQLRAVGGFLVSAALTAGQVQEVVIRSENGGPCTLENPWPGETVALERSGGQIETVSELRWTLPTSAGEELTLARIAR